MKSALIADNPVKVLLIEDNLHHSQLIRNLLSNIENTELDMEYSGRLSCGLKRLCEGDISAVLLDFSSPDNGGLNAFNSIHGHRPDMPVILLSSHDNEMTAIKAVQTGAQDYLVTGNTDSNILKRSIYYAIERKKAEQELRNTRDLLEMQVIKRTNDLEIINKELQSEIKERKQAEVILRESEERYRSLVENIKLGITLIDSDHNIIMTNDAQGKFFNKEASEFFGKKCYREFEKRQTVCDHCPGIKTMATGLPQDVYTEGVRDDGTRIPVWIQTFPTFGPDGKASGFIEVIEDITERKRMEEARLQSEEHYRTLINNIPLGITMIDTDYNIVMVNATESKIHNKPVNDLIGQKCYRAFEKKEEVCQLCPGTHAMATGSPEEIEREAVLDDGLLHHALVRAFPTYGPDCKATGFIEVVEDITEHKRTDEEIRQLNQELEQRVNQRTRKLKTVNLELKNFAHIVSHDLKAPLRGINQISDWLINDYSDVLDKKGKEMLDLLAGRVKRMHSFIGAILEYSKVGHGNEKKEQVNLNFLLTDLIDILAPPENIHIILPGTLPNIVCEKTRIEQVFQNLLGNAIKFMDKPQGYIRIECFDEGEFYRFAISDNGPGIDRRHCERIFQIFQTLTPRDVSENTGIGLTIVKKIIDLYNGKIWIKSEPGKNTTFFFTLPKTG